MSVTAIEPRKWSGPAGGYERLTESGRKLPRMLRVPTQVLAVGAVLALCGPAVAVEGEEPPPGETVGSEGDRTLHGRFTGDVKALLYVRDVEDAAPFYRDTLGFGFHGFSTLEGAASPYYAEMSAGALRFGLHEPMGEGQRSRIGQQRLYFRVEDLEAHHRRVAAWDAGPSEIFRRDWMDYFIAKDADGNEIVFGATDTDRHAVDPWTSAGSVDPNEPLEPIDTPLVLGVGGAFFRARDPRGLGDWYGRWLGLPVSHPHGASLPSDLMPAGAFTVWAPFPEDTEYFDPGGRQFMFNFVVRDLEEALRRVREGGAEVVGAIEEYDYGRFGWFVDPEGNKVELWQLPAR